MKKYCIAIDLTQQHEENLPILCSPMFDTEAEADKWYRTLNIDEYDLQRFNFGLDIIMCVYENEELIDSYVY